MLIADIASENLELALHIGSATIQPTPRVERVVEHEGADFIALAN
jgi:hypothetical protein